MAYNISNEYKQIIYSGDAKNKIKILFNNVELQDADRYCEKLTVKSRIIPNGAKTFSLNNFISKEAELILHDIDTSIIQDQISISIGTLVGNSYEYVPIGIFNIQDTPTNDKNKTTIKLRDNSVKFDFNYNAKPLIDSGGGTATKLQILQDICSKAGVTCNITSFIGSTDRIGIYDNTITARQYIADLAEQAGRIATINRIGELIFVNINSLTTWNIPLSIVEKYELGKAYKIGKVVYEDGVRKYETASTTYDTLFLDASNPYISSQEQVNSILQQVNNFTIDSVKTGKILGNPAIDGYDLINIYNDKVEGNPSIFKTLATNDLTYTGVLINTFDTQIGEDDREQNVSITGEATFKKWAKTEIDNINGEVLIQAGKIDNVEKEINPTDTSSGSSIYLEDSAETELIDFEVEGKTEQETRSGKNLLNATKYSSTNYISQLLTLKATTYTVNYVGDNSDGIYIRKADGTVPINGTTVAVAYNKHQFTFTISEVGNYYIQFYKSGDGFSSFSNAQLEEGSVATEYEEYGVMPSPEFPSELVSVGYENLFNWDNPREITLIKSTNRTITATPSGALTLEPGTYTLSFPNLQMSNNNYNLGVELVGIIDGSTLTNNYRTFTISETKTLQYLYIYLNNSDNANATAIFSQILLIKGTQAHSYIPYGKYGIEVKTNGKNLFDIEKSEQGTIDSNGNDASSNTAWRTKDYILVNSNNTYTISSLTSISKFIYQYEANGSFISVTPTGDNTSYTFTTNIKTRYIKFRVYYSNGTNYELIKDLQLQLEKNTQATSYEPYKSNTYLYTLDQPLRSNIDGTIKDLLYIRNGMLYVDRYIRNLNLAIADMNNLDAYPGWTNLTQLKNDYPDINTSFSSANISYQSNIGNQGGKYSLNTMSTGTLFLSRNQWNDMTQTDWQTNYPDLVLDFNYALSKPYTEELGTVQIPSTHKDITHIDTTDELEPNMNITYVRDTLIANYVESHVSELKINEQGIEARVQTIEESDYGSKINQLESSITSQEARLDVISTNIDTTTGEVREVTTSNGLKFNSNGLNLYTGQDSYNTLINNVGTYYKDGDNVISETTKDGFMATNSKNKGQHSYSYDETNDLYEFIDERVEADGEYCYATFYNGEE